MVAEVLRYLYPTADPLVDVIVTDRQDGQGAVITHWKTETLGPQPTAAQLATAEASAGFQVYLAAKATAAVAEAAVKTDLAGAAAQAVQDLDTYLALANPTNAQNQAALRMLCQQQKRIIKRLVQIA